MKEEAYKRIMRLVSVLVVLNLAFGGFLGLMLVEEKGAKGLTLPSPVNGTITINNIVDIDGSLLPNNTLDMDYNLSVIAGGELNLFDSTLVFQSDTGHRLWLKVDNGGKVNLINSTITVETSPDPGELFDNYEWVYWFNYNGTGGGATKEYKFKRLVPFNFTVTGGSLLTMSDGSALKFEGELYIAGSSEAFINDSVITSPSAPHSTHDWGVVVRIFGSSTVVFADSRVEKSPWYQGVWWTDEDNNPIIDPPIKMFNNHTIKDSFVYFISTYFDLDYRNKTSPDMYDSPKDNHFPPNVNKDHNALEIINSEVKFYGLTIDMTETNNIIPEDGSTAIEVMDTISDVTIYRWLAIYPRDNATVPVEGAVVKITNGWTTDPYLTLVNGLNNLNNNFWEMEYLKRVSDATLQMVGTTIQGNTGISGKVIVALASDMLTESGWPNTDQLDLYNIEASYLSDTRYLVPDLENFPRLFPEDNFVDLPMAPFDFAAPHPELYPEFVVIPPTSALEDVQVNISIRVWNVIVTGIGVDADNVRVQFWDGDPALTTSIMINETIIPKILPDSNETITINWTASSPGAHKIYIGVDRHFRNKFLDNLIPEINEDNNVLLPPHTITVLERPELSINASDIQFLVEGLVVDVVVNGTAVQISAYIRNTGGSKAKNVEVSFYGGTPIAPVDYIDSDYIDVPALSGDLASVTWVPYVGFHYVWIVVDESDIILEKDETNNSDYNTLTVNSRPDLKPSLEFVPPSPQYQGTVVTIKAVIINSGGWNVTEPVIVKFYQSIPDNDDYKIGEDTIFPVKEVSIPAGGSAEASITWLADPPGTHTFYARVDPDDDVDESDEANNLASKSFVVDPRPNLVIRSDDIVFSDAYPMNNTAVNINITIKNTGLSDVLPADTFYVQIWLDEIGGAGTLLTTIQIIGGVPSGGSVFRSYNWPSAVPPGKHEVLVFVDYNNTIGETNELDNMNSSTLIILEIPPDLVVHSTTNYPPFSPSPGTVIIEGFSPFAIKGFTLVEGTGTLIIRDSEYKIVGQRYDDEFTIVVKDTGNLTLEDSILNTELYRLTIYLFDSATLKVIGSTIDGNIDIIAEDTSNIIINDQSRIRGNIYANEIPSQVDISAINSTFDKELKYLGGSAFVELWGVYIAGVPASNDVITVSDNAKVYINWYLTVNVVDVNNVPIDGAVVTWYRSPPWGNTATQNSNYEGKAYFWLRGMNITTVGVVESIGNYLIKSQFTSPVTTDTYYPDSDPTVWMRDNVVKTIKFSSVMPELDPPLYIIPDDTIIAVDSPTKVITWINNSGPGNATNVPVKFDDDTTEFGTPNKWPYTIVVDYIAPGGSQYIEFQWIPKLVGWHNISIEVDPSQIIIEGDKANNYNTTPVWVTPRKADLVITNIWYMVKGNQYGPTENDTIEIRVNIKNLGETNAYPSPELAIAYYVDSKVPANLIGYHNISGVASGQTVGSKMEWTKGTSPPSSPPGTYTIIVSVDYPFDLVEEGNETNNDASIVITLKKYADVSPKSLEFEVLGSPVTSVPDTTLVTITATVENQGETNATNVNVRFLDGTQQIGDLQVISFIRDGGGTGTASVVWQATVIGILQIHTIRVNVSITNENILDNNEYSRDITVTLRPDLSVGDIDFSDNSPEEGQLFKINASVTNSGGTDTITFTVGFYDGDPNAGGIQISVDYISLLVGETGTVSVDWTPPVRGSHDIYVVADTQDIINEFNEENNEAFEVIVVYFVGIPGVGDIIVNNTNTPYNISSGGEVYSHRGYTLVEEAGVLTITYTTFQVLEGSDYQFNIIVRDQGTLIIEDGSVILTNSPLLRIYLYDNSTLYVTDSIIDSTIVEIQAFGSANLIVSESTINSYIKADQPNANVQIHAENSSLSQPFIYFGGTSSGVFINVTTPEVEISDSAKLEVFRWLKIYVKDGAGTGIEDSVVEVSYDPSLIEIPGSPKDSDFSGLALFDILTDIVTSTEWSGPLNYEAFAEFDFGGTIYVGGPKKVSFTSYQFDKINNVKKVTLELSELLPDLMVDSTSVVFKDKDGNIRTTVGVGEDITIEATVYNVGNAGTTSLTSVLVNFYHLIGTVYTLLGQDIIDTNMAANGGTGVASIPWTPESWEEGTNEEIHVHVNPEQTVRETTWSEDNKHFGTVNIVVPPDLDVTNIRFDIAGAQNVRNVTESEEVTIVVWVKNLGKQDASDVTIFVYDGFPDFDGDMKPDDPLPTGVNLVGDSPKTIVSISPGTEASISFTWDTTGMQRGHVIYVYALDAEPNGYIPDQILSNNNASKSFIVHPKPDLEFILIQDAHIKPYRQDGTAVIGDPELYRNLKLQARVFNDGQVFIQSVVVSFYEGGVSPGNLIGNDTISIHPTSPKNASVNWLVTGQTGARNIFVVVNPGDVVLESDYTNNQESETITVAYGTISVSFTQDINSKYDLGATIQIIGEAKFSNPEDPMVDIPYSITIYKGSSPYGSAMTGTTDSQGRIVRQIAAPNDPGDYSVEIKIDYGVPVTDSKEFKAEGEVPSWIEENWLLLLIIIGIGVLVVVLVGVLLGRYGLGRLVECGECGAFIPEGEKKCPKCGAIFEADTAKCSECGAWIPVTSKSCPECGAIFAGIEKEKKDYIERMKGQYAEYVEQYRDEAKKEIGTTMTDEEFLEWWKANPKYVGFEEWLSREEELRKGRTKNCPSCNTVNPESAAICFKCGTVFKKEEEEEEEVPGPPPPEVPPKVVPREVRPAAAPPTVVPKKVVKPPEVVPKKVVKGPPTVVPKRVMRPPEGGPPTVVPKKVIKKPPEEEEE